MRRILKRLQVPLPHEVSFNPYDNLYSEEEFFKLCKDYEVSHDPMKYRKEKFFGTYQHWGWADYIGPDSMTRWIIEKSRKFTGIGLLRIERDYY